jgi:hypothetical protein
MAESSGLLERTGSVVVMYFFSVWGLSLPSKPRG